MSGEPNDKQRPLTQLKIAHRHYVLFLLLVIAGCHVPSCDDHASDYTKCKLDVGPTKYVFQNRLQQMPWTAWLQKVRPWRREIFNPRASWKQ